MKKYKKPRRLKECKQEGCSFCETFVIKANKYIIEENRLIDEERKNKEKKKKQELISRQEEQRNKIQPDIEMEENPKNKIPMNIDEFEKIEVLGRGNCAFRAILASANLKPEEW